MTSARATAQPGRPPAFGPDRLAAALRLDELARLGWDPATEVFTPDPTHRLFGYAVCPVAGCGNEGRRSEGLCSWCTNRRAAAEPEVDLGTFCAMVAPPRRARGEQLCLVCRLPGACRPAAARGLCLSCNHLRTMRGQTVEAFVGGEGPLSPATPRASLGACSVLSCGRLAAHRDNRMCEAHDQLWRKAACPDLDGFRRQATPRRGERRGRVVLRGLSPRVVVEMLFGIQASLAAGRRASPVELRGAVDHLRRAGATTVVGIDVVGQRNPTRQLLRFVADQVSLACSDLDGEYAKDVWDLRVWGHGGRLSFLGGGTHRNGSRAGPGIAQPWLREAAKRWAFEELVSRTPGTVRTVLSAVGLWSEHLARRPDGGVEPAALGRGDAEAFLVRLGRLEAAGSISRGTRARTVDGVAQFLRACREQGLTQRGEVLARLPDDVVLRRADHPPPLRREGDDIGLALPEAVLAQLLSEQSLEALDQMAGPSCRAAVELLAGVGRRTAELCGLRLGCLDYDERTGADGEVQRSPVLVHDMPKVNKVGCRLPIHDREARIISAQQVRVQAAYPDTPWDRLVLFPRSLRNPDGTKPFAPGRLQVAMRQWVDRLAPLDSGERDADGRLVPFPPDRVFPYALRHTFAQRHADAGTPVDTLRELLGHDTVRTTLGYYRVTTKRKREAQDRLGPLQLDAVGRLVRPGVAGLGDAEALREQIGQVAVPMGVCTEPTNVAAHGGSCPFRHRCTGCEYFRTDPSYQAEMGAYLLQLLADRERLATALPQLAEWARRDAAPSDEEIDAVRRLVRANDEVLAGLDDDDRRAVEAAIATIRKSRAQLGVTFPVELRGLVRQPTPSLFPTIERAARQDAARG